jgi:hypothetical protein
MSVRLTNNELADLYLTRANQIKVAATEAKRFAELVKSCRRPLYDAYGRRGTLRGVREGKFDLTVPENQQGKKVLEEILGGIKSLKDRTRFNEMRQFRSVKETEQVYEDGVIADTASEAIGTGCSWNGRYYRPLTERDH